MNRPLIVKDRTGATVTRHDGKMLAGDTFVGVHVPLMFADGVPASTVQPAPLVLTDAQKATAQAGIDAALRDQAAKGTAPLHPGDPNTLKFTDAQISAMEGHRAAMTALLTDRWKGPQAARLVADSGKAETYEQRMVRQSGGYSHWAGHG